MRKEVHFPGQIEERSRDVLELLLEADDVGDLLGGAGAEQVPLGVVQLRNGRGDLRLLDGLGGEEFRFVGVDLFPNSLIPVSLGSSLQDLAFDDFQRALALTLLAEGLPVLKLLLFHGLAPGLLETDIGVADDLLEDDFLADVVLSLVVEPVEVGVDYVGEGVPRVVTGNVFYHGN